MALNSYWVCRYHDIYVQDNTASDENLYFKGLNAIGAAMILYSVLDIIFINDYRGVHYLLNTVLSYDVYVETYL